MQQASRQPGVSATIKAPQPELQAAQIPAILWAVDRELRFTTSLGAGLAVLGQQPGQVVGRTLAEVFQNVDPTFLPVAAARRALSGEASRYTFAWAGRTFQCQVAPLRDDGGAIIGSTGVALDLGTTPDRESPGGEARYRRLFRTAQRQAQELALLDQVRTALTQELDLPLVFRTVVDAIAQTCGYPRVGLYLVAGAYLQIQQQVGLAGAPDRLPLGEGVPGRVACTGQPVLCAAGHTDAPCPAGAGPSGAVCVPLLADGQVTGVLHVEGGAGAALTDADLRLMTALGAHLGAAISRVRLSAQIHTREQQYQAVVESIHEVLFQTDGTGGFAWLNRAWTAITGFSSAASLGTPLVDYVDPADQAGVTAALEPILDGRVPSGQFEARFRTFAGGVRWLEGHAQAPAGRPGVTGTLTDVTARREAEAGLRRQAAELAALHATTLGLLDQLDPDELLGAIVTRAGALLDTPDGYLYVLDPATQELVVRAGIGIFASQIDFRLARGAGVAGRVWNSGVPLVVPDYSTWPGHHADLVPLGFHAVAGIPLRVGGAVGGVLGLAYTAAGRTFDAAAIGLLERFGQLAALALANARLYAAARKELGERIYMQETLAHLALHDSLTDLPNRVLLRERIALSISQAAPHQQATALLVLDLDGFKEVNDTLGHALGDRLLCAVATRLRAAVRAADTVARLGGDEFAIVLPGAEERAAARVTRQLLRRLAEPVLLDGYHLTVRGSIGIALYPAHGLDAETLLRRADVAMYMAKHQRGGYAIYTPDKDPYSPRRLALAGELRTAIAGGGLVLYYQPKVSRRSGQITGVEALVRWPHPEHGLLPPDAFLPIAEQMGLLGLLSEWVLGAALQQAQAWQAVGLTLPVAVNLTMRDLHDALLPELIERLLAGYGLAGDQLQVEITEDAAMADPVRVHEVLSRLRALGVRVAIDDFGTGYSSMAQLTRLPLDQLKIDKVFLGDLATSANDQVIVRAMIDLGHHLGLGVVAEGVAGAEAWALLGALGCDEGQGYYLSPPLSSTALGTWLADEPAHRVVAATPARR